MIVTQTPLRLSILGGNTDFPEYFLEHGGACLTASIDKYVYCIVKERFDDQIWINYSVKEIVNNVNEIKHDLVREALRLVGVTKGIEITFLSDIPSNGSGLGSSSAVTVGLLNALHQYQGESVGARQLAEEACRIEVDILKKPIGYQDQYAVAFGGFNLIEFGKSINIRPLEFTSDSLMLFYTGIQRKSEEVLSKMKLDKEILDQNKELALNFVGTPGSEFLGTMLDTYWRLKKKLNSSVTNREIDLMYDRAMSIGALGGKIVGAGGGGFLLLIVPPDRKDPMRKALGLRELPFNFSRDGSKIIFNIRK